MSFGKGLLGFFLFDFFLHKPDSTIMSREAQLNNMAKGECLLFKALVLSEMLGFLIHSQTSPVFDVSAEKVF